MRKVKRIHDTRASHQPAPVRLPRKTMVHHVAERMRLIRQGDQREIAGVEAAIKQVRTTAFHLFMFLCTSLSFERVVIYTNRLRRDLFVLACFAFGSGAIRARIHVRHNEEHRSSTFTIYFAVYTTIRTDGIVRDLEETRSSKQSFSACICTGGGTASLATGYEEHRTVSSCKAHALGGGARAGESHASRRNFPRIYRRQATIGPDSRPGSRVDQSRPRPSTAKWRRNGRGHEVGML